MSQRPPLALSRSARFAVLLAAILVVPGATPALASGPFAGRITAANADGRRVGGLGAVGGTGDFALSNGTLCAVVSDPSHATDVSPRGGFLVDLGHCGAADDQLGNLLPLLNVSRQNVPRVEDVEATFDARAARVRTRARWHGLELNTDYVLDTVDPERLRMETRVARVAPGGRLSVLALLSVHPNATLRAFRIDTEHPELNTGFVHPQTPGEGLRSLLGGLARADVEVLVGPEGEGPGIAYGVQLASAWREDGDGSRDALPGVALNGAAFSLLGVFSRPFWLGGGARLGLLELAQSLLMDLPPDETLHVVQHVHVGRRADVASVTDGLWPAGPEISGRMADPSARLHVTLAGHPITYVRPDADGRFAFRVPRAGDVELRVVAPGGREVRLPMQVSAAGAELGRVELGGAGRLLLPRGHAMRLVFQGLAGTPDPRIGDDLLGLRFGDAVPPASSLANYVSLAGVPGDPGHVTLPPGRYRVVATRGLERSVEQTEVVIRADEDVPLAIGVPRRVLETPGWILADLHVHAGGSFDSTLPYADRVRSFVAQGGEVLVSTEHDNVVDYRPLVERMGLAGVVRVIPGLEVTSISRTEVAPHTAGHANALPLEPIPRAHRGGALRSQGVRLRDAIAELRGRGGRRVFQLNHPRLRDGDVDDEAFFTHLSVGRGFEPALPLDAEPNAPLVERDPRTGTRDLDFDAMELLNGATDEGLPYYKRTRADWLSLLLQGERRTATANSDSHKYRQLVAIPVNYVRVADDRPARLDQPAFVDALLAGALIGTTGPFVEVTLGQAGPGGRFTGRSGTLRVEVRAADWVPVDELRVYVDGALHARQPIARGGSAELALAFAADAFVTVEVQGDLRGEAAARYRAVAPRLVPFAFSNPIFVDADGDGAWTAPGLPAPLPATIADPLGS